MIKKILISLLAITLAFIMSSYSTDNNTTSKQDTVQVTKQLNVNANVNIKQSPAISKADEPLVRKAMELMDASIELSKSKQALMENVFANNTTRIDQICEIFHISSDELFKKARADTMIKFWSNILTILIVLIGLYCVIKYSINNTIDWKTTLIISIVFTLLTVICQQDLYNVLSTLFNNQYLQIKEILNLI